MVKITLIPAKEFKRVCQSKIDKHEQLQLLADMCRANTLAVVKRAGSGHLGSSLSSLDLVTYLYYEEMDSSCDIYFSSKGHDVPGLYSVLFSLGILPRDRFIGLRRLGGTPGHPEVGTPGIEANTGSLGMGISKAKGMALAKRLRGNQGRIFVMVGDGELQEGQIYEALQSAVHQQLTNLHVVVDHNKVQTDKPVSEVLDLGDLETKFRAFGWHVGRCNGHNPRELEKIFLEFRQVKEKPKILIADTIKGRGVSFMEHPAALEADKGFYRWHSGAPDDESYSRAFDEILARMNHSLGQQGLSPLILEEIIDIKKESTIPSGDSVSEAFGEALVEVARKRKDLVVLDCDLASDCHLRAFEREFPERFIENGIAEQDMVSTAGGLALQGFLPVVNSFGAFLAARANEQIYNNSCEKTRLIYVCHYAGLVPAGPGSSHQSLRDIALFGSLPHLIVLQPCNSRETRMVVDYCVNEAKESSMIRLFLGPSPREIPLSEDYLLTFGRGVSLTEGEDALLFAYGPLMLGEALWASEDLKKQGFGLKVVNLPWLNRIDASWLEEVTRNAPAIYVLEDHFMVGGLGDFLLHSLVSLDLLEGKRFKKMGVEGLAACGTTEEVLRYHRLDHASLAERILQDTKVKQP